MAGEGDSTVHRLLLVMAASAAVIVSALPGCAAQDVSIAALPGTADFYRELLAFSKDGRFLREIVPIGSVAGTELIWHTRAITYDAATGKVRRVWNLQPDTACLSATTDGRIAVISVDRGQPQGRAHLFLFDTNTNQTRDVPSRWFDADEQNPYAQISADGQLVSAYTESGPDDGPEIVTVYNWRTKRLVATQATGLPAGGFSWGGVTVDGKIEFLGNRGGGEVVDPKTGRVLVNVSPNSRRSQDGAWVVDFPNTIFGDAPREVSIKNGRSGEVVGRLDLPISDDEEDEKWAWGRGAFCGTSGRFIAATRDTVQAFEIPSGKKIAEFPSTTWRDVEAMKTNPTVTVACSFNGKRVAIRSGARLTLHDLN
jgi:hypothetical protein